MQIDPNDLLSIQPESWCNIPLPLKEALTLLTQHSASQSLQLRQLFTQQEDLKMRLFRQEQDLTAGLGKWEERLSTLERDIEEKLRRNQEEMTGKLEFERKERIIEAKEADRRYTEASTRLTSLLNHYSTALTDLKAAQNNLKAAVRSEVQSLLTPELNTVRDNFEEKERILGKSLGLVTEKVREVEEYQRNEVVSRLEIVENTVEMALQTAKELKNKEKQQEMHSETQIQTVLTPLKDRIVQLEADLKRIGEENKAETAQIAANFNALNSKTTQNHEEMQKQTDIRIELASNRLSTASKSAFNVLTESLQSLETALKGEFDAKMSVLDQNWSERLHQYVAQELKDIHEKLSVRSI